MSKRADAANAEFRKNISAAVMSLNARSLFDMIGYAGVGTGGSRRNPHATRSGPGRRRLPANGKNSRVHSAGTRLFR